MPLNFHLPRCCTQTHTFLIQHITPNGLDGENIRDSNCYVRSISSGLTRILIASNRVMGCTGAGKTTVRLLIDSDSQ